MKRVLSMMLTMMLVITMFSGIITAEAAEYEVVTQLASGDYSTSVAPALTTTAAPTNPTKMILYLSAGYTSGVVTLKENLDRGVAAGLTSAGAFELVPGGDNNILRFYGHSDVTVNDLYQIKLRVYIAESSDSAVNNFTATFGANKKGTRSSSATGQSPTFANIPVGQWTEISAVLSPTSSRIANGFTVGFKNGTAYPTKIYVDGNLSAAIVQEKAAEPAIAIDSCFKNNMLFQRNTPINVWGTSKEAGKTVTATLGSNTVTTTTDATGKWKVTLPAMSAQSDLTLNVSCNDEAQTSINITNVAIGEVILAAGQSNMNRSVSTLYETTIEELADEKAEVQAAVADLSNVDVRMLNLNDTNANSYTWAKVTKYEDSSAADCIYHRSLIGFMTAYKLAKEKNIPVAFIDAAVGGAAISAFLSPEVLASRDIYSGMTAADSSVTAISTLKTAPAGLYNAWLSHIKGLKVGAVLWYQGEEDAENGVTENLYSHMLYDLINQLRADFGNSNAPVMVCQLAPYSNAGFVNIRQSQLDTAKRMNGVYLIPTCDAGPTESETDTIHPINKMPVIDRCLNALKYHKYGEITEYSSPQYKSMEAKDNEAILTFDHSFKYELLADLHLIQSFSKGGSGSVVGRFGGASANRMEFRDDAQTGSFTSVSKATPSDYALDYPGIMPGAKGVYIAKATRSANVGYVRFAELVGTDKIDLGDKVRITVRAYPTDIRLADGTAAGDGEVDKIEWAIKGLSNTKEDGTDNGNTGVNYESVIYLTPNQWNTIEYEFIAYKDMTSGAQIVFDYQENIPFPATIFFDDMIAVEVVKADNLKNAVMTTVDGAAVKGFEISGDGVNFYPAQATISENKITVSSPEVEKPVEVRYCYVPKAEDSQSTLGGNVVSKDGWPLAPFKATLNDMSIDATEASEYSYIVALTNNGYNEAKGRVVAALYDGNTLSDVQFVRFAEGQKDVLKTYVKFNPQQAPVNPSVKIMAWEWDTNLKPMCEPYSK